MRASKLLLSLALSSAALAVPDESVSSHVDKQGHTTEPETYTVFVTPTELHPETNTLTAVLTSKVYPYPDSKRDDHVKPHSEHSKSGEDAAIDFKANDAQMLPRGEVPYDWGEGDGKTSQHAPRDEPCDVLRPTCHGHDENADANTVGMALNDWTRWACTRGVQWACQYPDFDERDLAEHHPPPTNCGYYSSRECVSAHAHQTRAVDEVETPPADVDSAPLAKRHDPFIPTSVGQTVTHHTSTEGQSQTMVFVLAQTSPDTVYSDTFWAAGTTHSVIISELRGAPGAAVQTFIAGNYTESVTTSTSDAASIGRLTSVNLVGSQIGNQKREHIATATPPAHGWNGKPNHSKDWKHDAPRNHKDSPFTSVHRDIDRVDTMTVLDERPGHTTLNPEVAKQTDVHWTGVTVVEDHSGVKHKVSATTDAEGMPSLATLGQVTEKSSLKDDSDEKHTASTTTAVSSTTDAEGKPSLVTLVHDTEKSTVKNLERPADESSLKNHRRPADMSKFNDHWRPTYIHKDTVIMNFYLDEADTTVITLSQSGKNAIVTTARVAKLAPSTTKKELDPSPPPPGFDAPIPKVETSSVAPPIIAPVPKVLTEPGNPTVLKVITQTVTVVKPGLETPVPALRPVDWDRNDIVGWNHVMEMPLEVIMARHPDADWENEIPRLAEHYRQQYPIMDDATSWKFAFNMLHKRFGHDEIFPPHSDGEVQVTQVMVNTDGTAVPMTAPTQAVRGTPVILDPMMKYRLYNAFTHAVAPTGSCHKYEGDDDDDTTHPLHEIHEYNETECAIEQCMWQYMRPINITTAVPAMMMKQYEVNLDYFTHKTHLQAPHWGTKDPQGIYYPTSTTVEFISGTARPTVVRAWPKGEEKRLGYHGRPQCNDLDSCYTFCQNNHDDDDGMPSWLIWVIVALSVLFIGVLLLLCCLVLSSRRKKRDPERRKSSLSEKLGRKPTEREVVVNQVNGNATDPAGRPADPATATTAAAGPAAGAEAARDPAPGDNGRGTTGRRAEEGRGRVNFADGEKPGDEGKEKPSGEPKETTTEVKEKPAGEPSSPPATTEHAEPQPVPDKDGAGGVGTGRQQPDVGSMRGRKRNRPEGIAGLGF